jgi:hypothetical protein
MDCLCTFIDTNNTKRIVLKFRLVIDFENYANFMKDFCLLNVKYNARGALMTVVSFRFDADVVISNCGI